MAKQPSTSSPSSVGFAIASKKGTVMKLIIWVELLPLPIKAAIVVALNLALVSAVYIYA